MSATKWVESRIEEMLRTPRMWGTQEAVELQLLLLIEFWYVLTKPSELTENPRVVLDGHTAYFKKRLGSGVLPASGRNLSWDDFVEHLSAFKKTLIP